MVDINPNVSTIRAQLQAQLQASKTNIRARTGGADASPNPADLIEERLKVRGDERRDNRQLPVKLSDRSNQLSSARELDQAKARAAKVAGNNREAPAGRTSIRENELRNQPLGQIIDIRV
jgi:hypothetical protein